MKISKLFHWLYATLMFLPLVFFIPSVFYYGFNEYATNTETTQINYKYQSNEVNTLDDLVEGNIYYLFFDSDFLDLDLSSNSKFEFTIIDGYIEFETSDLTADYYGNPIDYNGVNITYDDNLNHVLYSYSSISVPMYYGYIEEMTFIYNDNCYLLFEDNNLLPQHTDYNVIESVSVNTDDTITDKLNRSWNAIFDLPMFSWTKTTFVSGAFVYISGLFGVQANNPLNYLFAYFVSISICWLVFDVLLYVPNLAHRWLDKGAIE